MAVMWPCSFTPQARIFFLFCKGLPLCARLCSRDEAVRLCSAAGWCTSSTPANMCTSCYTELQAPARWQSSDCLTCRYSIQALGHLSHARRQYVAAILQAATPVYVRASEHISSLTLQRAPAGTTSKPKGVPLTHANLAASLQNIVATYELTDRDRSLLVMPLFHVHGLMAGE